MKRESIGKKGKAILLRRKHAPGWKQFQHRSISCFWGNTPFGMNWKPNWLYIMQEASIDLKLENKTGYTVTVKDSTGEEISVGNGEEFFPGKTTDSAGQTGTDPEDEEESEEPKDLSEDPSDDDGYEDPATQMKVEVKGENVTVNGQLLPDGQVAGVTEDGAVDFLPADEQTNELKNKIDALFTDDKGLESLIGSDGLVHYQVGTNLDHLISSLENFQNYDGLAFNSKGTATVAALAPMDLRLSGKINTLLVGPEAPGINIIQERGLVESMLVLEPDSNLFLGGYVRKLYAARTVTVSTLHRHTPAEKTVYVVEPTTTEGGQYTIVTYCTDPTCGIELDSKTYYTDPLPPPVPEPAPEKEPEPVPAANPCANGHTGGTATCQAQAICTVCGQPYGELGAHVPGDKTPSADGNGTIICCKVCGICCKEYQIWLWNRTHSKQIIERHGTVPRGVRTVYQNGNQIRNTK